MVSCILCERKFDWAYFLPTILVSYINYSYRNLVWNTVKKSVSNKLYDKISLFIRLLYFQSFLTRKLTISRYFYRDTIDSNLVKESLYEKNGHYSRILWLYVHVVLRMCIQTGKLYPPSFLCACIVYRNGKETLFAYLPRISCKLLGHIFAFLNIVSAKVDATINVFRHLP